MKYIVFWLFQYMWVVTLLLQTPTHWTRTTRNWFPESGQNVASILDTKVGVSRSILSPSLSIHPEGLFHTIFTTSRSTSLRQCPPAMIHSQLLLLVPVFVRFCPSTNCWVYSCGRRRDFLNFMFDKRSSADNSTISCFYVSLGTSFVSCPTQSP